MFTTEILRGLLYRVERDLHFAATDEVNLFLYNYHPIIKNRKTLIRLLAILKKIEEELINNIPSCFTDKQLLKLQSLVKLNTNPAAITCYPILVDGSKKQEWELAHPYCISRTRWEELAYKICGDLKFDIKVIDKSCDLLFDLTTNTISCNTTAALSIHQKLCDLDYKVKRTDKECAIDYNLLLENHPDCGITYNLYKRLIDCNMSYDIIHQILCDNLSIDMINNTPTIKSVMGDYVLGKDIKFKQVVTPSQCHNSLCKTGECTTDYPNFIKALLNDYNLTKIQKEQILKEIKW